MFLVEYLMHFLHPGAGDGGGQTDRELDILPVKEEDFVYQSM